MNNAPHTTESVLAWFDRHRLRLWLGIGLLLLIGFNTHWRAGPDSAIHATVARSLAEGRGFTHPTGLESTINPGLAYLTAFTFRLFGPDSFAAINALMLACAAGTLALTYHLARLRFDRATAVLIVCMLAINETFYRYAYQLLTDLPFLLALVSLLLGMEWVYRGPARRIPGIALMLVSVIVMALFRSIVLTVLAAGVITALVEMVRGRRYRTLGPALGAALLIAGLLLTLGGGLAVIRDSTRAMQLIDGAGGGTLQRVFTDNGPALLTEHLPEAAIGVDFGHLIGAPIGLVLIVAGLSLYKVRPFWAVLIGLFLLQWTLLITAERYMLVIMPLLAIAWWRLACILEIRFKPPAARWLITIILTLWFAPNLVRIGVFVVEQRATPFLASYQDGRYDALQAVADKLTQTAQPGDLIIADQAPQLVWYTRLPVHGSDTLPTYGPGRDQTLKRVRDAKRILMISPVDELLNDRVSQLKLRQVSVLQVIPTPGYEEVDAYKIIEMRMHEPDWDNYRQRRERRLERTRDTEQGDSQPQQPAGQSEQPGDQLR